MNDIICLTKFTVFNNCYETVLAKQVSKESLIGEAAWYSPDDPVKITLPDINLKQSIDVYNPLVDTPFLYLEISKINDIMDLLKFVNRYGLPTGLSKTKNEGNCKFVTITESDVIETFLEIQELQKVLNTWYKVLNEKENSVKKFDIISYIVEVLNKKKNWKESLIALDSISRCVTFNDLFEVAYFQLTNSIVQKRQLSKCIECNEIFEVKHGSQKFCPPKRGLKRSTCENTHRLRKRRLKNK